MPTLITSAMEWCRCSTGGAVLGQQLAAGSGAVRVPGEGEHLGVMDEAVNHRRSDVIGEGLTPSSKRQVRGHHDRTDLIAWKRSAGKTGWPRPDERDVADFVDDDQL